jgi:hypothetical protein
MCSASASALREWHAPPSRGPQQLAAGAAAGVGFESAMLA